MFNVQALSNFHWFVKHQNDDLDDENCFSRNIPREFDQRWKTSDRDSAGESKPPRKRLLDQSLSRHRRFQRRSTLTCSGPCKPRWRFWAILKPFEESTSSLKRSPGCQKLDSVD